MNNTDNSSLESQCDVAHNRRASLWNIADFSVAVAFRVASAGIDGRIDPSGGSVVEVEDVVDVDAENQFLDALVREGEDIVGREVARREARQRTLLAFGVVEVLARHVVGVPRGCQSVLLVGDEAVEDHRGREGKRAVVVVNHVEAIAIVSLAAGISIALPVVPVFDMLVEILDFVLAECSIALDGESRKNGPCCGEFYAESI